MKRKDTRWVNLDGYMFEYRIGDAGTVQRKRADGSWRTMKTWFLRPMGHRGAGKLVVKLTVSKGVAIRYDVDRLVEAAFMPPRPEGYILAHKNGCAGDCAVENLYYTTYHELGKLNGGNGRKSVEKISRTGEVLDLYRSIQEAADKNYVSRTTVFKHCSGKVKDRFRLLDFSFRYEEQED